MYVHREREGKRERVGKTHIRGKRMEERPILIVRHLLDDLMLPNHPPRARKVNQPQPPTLGSPPKHDRARQARVGPL